MYCIGLLLWRSVNPRALHTCIALDRYYGVQLTLERYTQVLHWTVTMAGVQLTLERYTHVLHWTVTIAFEITLTEAVIIGMRSRAQ